MNRVDLIEKVATILKAAGILNFLGKMSGYHDTKRLSEMSGVPEPAVHHVYHTLMVPNVALYSYEDAAKDMKDVWALRGDNNKTNKLAISLHAKYQKLKGR